MFVFCVNIKHNHKVSVKQPVLIKMNENLISEFVKLGTSKKLAAVTSQVYLELCEVKKYHDVEYTFNETLNRIILKAKKSKNGPAHSFVSFPYSEELTMNAMHNLLNKTGEKSLIFVFVHPDSTCVYYEISDGLVEPTEIVVKHLQRENRQEKLDVELKKNRDLLEQSALLGIPITIPRKEERKDKIDKNVNKDDNT